MSNSHGQTTWADRLLPVTSIGILTLMMAKVIGSCSYLTPSMTIFDGHKTPSCDHFLCQRRLVISFATAE